MSAPIRASIGAASATRDLWQLVETDDISQLGPILARGADVNAVNSAGVTMLMRAAYYGCARMVKALIEAGADPNAARSDRFNPLMLAAFFGHDDVVRTLVEGGADVSLAGRFETSAEMWANARSFFDIADYLREVRNPANETTPREFPGTRLEKNARELERIAAELEKEPEFTSLKNTVRVKNDSQYAVSDEANKTEIPVVRTLKEPPEIWDLVHETPPQFNPGVAFITRLTSSTTNLVVAGLLVFVFSVTSIYAFLKLHKPRMVNVSSTPPATTTINRVSTAPSVTSEVKTTQQEQSVVTSEQVNASVVENNTTEPVQDPNNVINVPTRGGHATRGLLSNRRVKSSGLSSSETANAASALNEIRSGNAQTPGERSSQSSTQDKKLSTTTLSPQLIAPSNSSSPAPKAKVIQWP